MKRALVLVLIIPICLITNLFALTGEEILQKVDENVYATSSKYEGRFEIHKGDRIFEKTFKGWAEGEEKSFVEFTNPEDYGVKYLKLGDEMWIAEENDVVKISGHLLKRSVMGSDFNFEDLMSNEKLIEMYNVTIAGEDTVQGNKCYILNLDAKDRDAPYKRQEIWVDKENYIPYKYNYYALSGRLMKSALVLKTQLIKEKHYPTMMKMTDELKKGSYTLFEMTDLELDIQLPENVFSQQNLRR
ncbi:MAG: outer membrane lipoprotein-sorting protein [Deltaproteobacteria bacterium]|nr:outer membrane lipoprotein-sorting protein [Deltaproteobacteria bacterium]